MSVTRYNYDIVIHHRITVYVPITTALGPEAAQFDLADPNSELVNDDAVVDNCKCA